MSSALQRYAILGHRRVSGWIEPEILQVVASLSRAQDSEGVRGGVAEIGVHHGRFFFGLYLTSKTDDGAVAIDLFADQGRNIDGSGKGDEAVFREHLRRYAGPDHKVAVVSADSSQLDGEQVKTLAGGPIRLFSVDGGHYASLVEHDMNTAMDSLTPGGVIIGDDVFNIQWPGCIEGTLAFLDKRDDVAPFAICFNKVLFAQQQYAARYRKVVEELARRQFWRRKESEMRGHSVVVAWRSQPTDRARLVAKRLLGRDPAPVAEPALD